MSAQTWKITYILHNQGFAQNKFTPEIGKMVRVDGKNGESRRQNGESRREKRWE